MPDQVDWRALDLKSHVVTLYKNGNKLTSGKGGDVLGHPLTALTWLVCC